MTRRLYYQIGERIAGLIAGGEFPPGANLPAERELAARLGVSRSSVREAVVALEVMGLVEVRVGNGVLVLPRAARLQEAGMQEGGAFETRLAALPRMQPDPELRLGLGRRASISTPRSRRSPCCRRDDGSSRMPRRWRRPTPRHRI